MPVTPLILHPATVPGSSDPTGDEWPMYRGQLNNTGVTQTSPQAGPDPCWIFSTGNVVDTSAAVVGGRVYVGSDDCNLYCINSTTGAFIWSYGTSDWIRSSPAVADGCVYLGFYYHTLICLNATTGAEKWALGVLSGIWSSPAVANGRVYVGAYYYLYCYNATTGAFLWYYPTGSWVESSPAVVDGRVYVGSNDHKIYCLNATTGAFFWSYTTNGEVHSSPAVASGRVYVGASDRKVYCLNASTGASLWNYTLVGGTTSSPAVFDGRVYIGGDKFYCLNATTGALVWSYATGFIDKSSPAVANGFVYVGSGDSYVYCLNAATGALVWSYKTGHWVFASPAVAGGRVYVGSFDNKMYCLPMISVPTAPRGIMATTGAEMVNLTWSPPVANGGSAITGYRIYQSIALGNETLIATIGNVTTYASTGLTNGITYYFKVAAVNAAGTGNNSTETNATPGFPDPPRNFQASGGNTQAVLTWQNPLNNGGYPITNYRIYQGIALGNETLIATIGNVTTYTSTGLTNGIIYYFKVAAVNSVGTGANSTELGATPKTVPTAPQSLIAIADAGQVWLSWVVPASNGGSWIQNYRVYRGTTSGGETLIATIGNVTTYTSTGLINGIIYYFKVAAVNVAGTGARSTEIYAAPGIPDGPQNFQASGGEGLIVLFWQAPVSNGGFPITNYAIYRGTVPGGETLYITVANTTSYTDTNVTNGQTYYYKISAINEIGNGPIMGSINATPALSISTITLWILLTVLLSVVSLVVVVKSISIGVKKKKAKKRIETERLQRIETENKRRIETEHQVEMNRQQQIRVLNTEIEQQLEKIDIFMKTGKFENAKASVDSLTRRIHNTHDVRADLQAHLMEVGDRARNAVEIEACLSFRSNNPEEIIPNIKKIHNAAIASVNDPEGLKEAERLLRVEIDQYCHLINLLSSLHLDKELVVISTRKMSDVEAILYNVRD
nr:PQQ-binding-like beta-propeller repeat protein [Candidatus Sigynarchaeota archaeon]